MRLELDDIGVYMSRNPDEREDDADRRGVPRFGSILSDHAERNFALQPSFSVMPGENKNKNKSKSVHYFAG
jgi:hypothetical protein